jgi:Fe-S cluster biogenesis protein NfuA
MMLVQEHGATEQFMKLDVLLEEIQSLPDPDARSRVAAIVQGLMALYGEGLARILAIIGQHDDLAMSVDMLAAITDDDLVADLLLLHDLHPTPLEIRVARALEEVRPYLHSHGGNVELLGIVDGVAQLRLQGSYHGSPSSTVTLKLAIEEALLKAAPDLLAIETEEAVEPSPPSSIVPATALHRMERANG